MGKVLILNNARGGVASAWMLHEMTSRDMAPAALLRNTADPFMAQGAALAALAFMHRFTVTTGDLITVDPQNGTITVHTAG